MLMTLTSLILISIRSEAFDAIDFRRGTCAVLGVYSIFSILPPFCRIGPRFCPRNGFESGKSADGPPTIRQAQEAWLTSIAERPFSGNPLSATLPAGLR